MSFFTVLISSKIAMGAVALSTLAAGGTVAAAYTGNLPAPLQQSAHSLIGAPAPIAPTESTTPIPADTATSTPTPLPSSTPVGPDATGPAAFGLCQAYTHGGLATSSIAYGSLLKAAGSAGNITVYCTTIASPGKSATHQPATPGGGATQSASHRPASTSTSTSTHTAAPALTPPVTTGAANGSVSTGRP